MKKIPGNGNLLNVLSLEDSVLDFSIICEQLVDAGFNMNISRVEKKNEFEALIRNTQYDIILADFSLPGFHAFGALQLCHEICPDVPFICVSGAIGEETAIELLKKGAVDYIMKDKLERLPIVIKRAIDDAKEKESRRQTEKDLLVSEKKYRDLVENALIGIYTTNYKGKFLYANNALCNILGYDSITDLQLFDVRSIYRHKAEREIFLETIIKSGQLLDYEIELVTKSGRIINSIISAFISGDVITGMLMDISERKRAEQNLIKSQEQLKIFAEHLHTVREEERVDIARELHDNLGQNLSAIKMDICMLIKRLNDINDLGNVDPIIRQAGSMIPMIETTINQVRKISSELRPLLLDELGLIPAIERYIEEFANRTGITCSFVSKVRRIRIERNYATAVFRILQEALTNVMRHARASSVFVRIMKSKGRVVFEIDDDGIGIKAGKIRNIKSVGLLGMRERALLIGGELVISALKGKGTRITLNIPIKS